MTTVLGFDVSSTCIGYCALEINNNIITVKKIHYLKPIKHSNIIQRLAHTRDKINEIINLYNPDYIALEEIISFMKGKSTAKTIITLTAFNRMIGLAAYDHLKCPPNMFNVMSLRHGLKHTKQLPSKEEMPEVVALHLNIKFPYIYNKKNKIKPESYDMADGVVVALYQAFILTGKIKKK